MHRAPVEYTAEYLSDLLKDKQSLATMPLGMFVHVDRLVDNEVKAVRQHLFECSFTLGNIELPEPDGPYITLQEKVFVPVKEFPDVRTSKRGFSRRTIRRLVLPLCSSTLLDEFSDHVE